MKLHWVLFIMLSSLLRAAEVPAVYFSPDGTAPSTKDVSAFTTQNHATALASLAEMQNFVD